MAPMLLNPSRFTVAGVLSYPATIVNDGPLAYYRTGEAAGTTMVDASGNGRDGVYGAGVTLGVAGAISDGDKAVSTSGASTGCGDVAYGTWMDVTNAVSMEAWVKWTGSPATSMFWSRTGGGSFQSGLFVNAGTIAWNVRTGASSNIVSGSGFNDGNWHHVVGTYDGANYKLYVDKVLANSAAKTGNMATGSLGLQVGGRGQNYFTGSVDEPAFYGYALSAAQVAAHFDAH